MERTEAPEIVSPGYYLIETDEERKIRLDILKKFNPKEHIKRWEQFDKRKNQKVIVEYYPAAWRIYELNLRYPYANFETTITYMDAEKDFCIVKARLFLGPDYNLSPKRAEAHKQGSLLIVDKIETGAKARAARDFGIGTEYALDMEDSLISEERETTNEQPQPNQRQPTEVEAKITERQINGLKELCKKLGKQSADNLETMSFLEAKAIIQTLTAEYRQQQAQKTQPEEPENNEPQPQEEPENNEPQPQEATTTITTRQLSSIRKLCEALGKAEPDNLAAISELSAKKLIQMLTAEYRQQHTRQS